MNANQIELEMSTRLGSKLDKMFDQFDKACSQSDRLQLEISNIKVRCERARKKGQAKFLYQQQMRQLIMQGILGMYGHYAERKAESIKMVARAVRDLYGPASREELIEAHNSTSDISAEDVMGNDADEEDMEIS